MSREVTIPGGTAVLRGADEIDGRGRKLVRAAAISATPALGKLPPDVVEVPPEDETPEQRDARLARIERAMEGVSFTLDEALAMDTLREASVVASLKSWTRPEKLPTMDTIGDLPAEVYDALLDAVGAVPDGTVQTDFSVTTDKGSPTPGSND